MSIQADARTRQDVDVVVCIGLEKTGTTMLQKTLASERRFLESRGVVYPQLLGGENHIFLAAYCQEDSKTDDVRAAIYERQNTNLPALRRRVDNEIRMVASRRGVRKVILFNEHLHSRLTERSEVERLHELVHRIGRPRIVVILRRQDKVAESSLSTMIKGGRSNIEPIIPDNGELPLYYRYADLLEMYERVFGDGSVAVGIYEDQESGTFSLFDLFEKLCDLDFKIPRPDSKSRANAALRRDGLVLLARINKLAAENGGLSRRERETVLNALGRIYSGRPKLLTRSRVESFLASCREQNERVRRKWFPDRPILFPEDTSDIPDEIPADPVPDSEVDAMARGILLVTRAVGEPRASRAAE